MEILELNLQHFGKFQEHRMKLLPGMNIIYGGNETGKTTIHAFIRAMFFGIEPGRGKKGEEYILRQPWENPAYFAGSMRLREDGQVYRIERNFHKSEKKVRLICETTGQELEAGWEELSRFLGGMSETAFRNTVFIPQAGSETDAGLAEELQKFMINFQETGDGNLDVNRALARLKGKRKELETKKKQEQELLDKKIARGRLELEYVEKDLQRMERENAGGETRRNQNPWKRAPQNKTEEQREPEPEIDGSESGESFFRRFLLSLNVLLLTGGCLGLACGVFASGLPARAGLTALGIVLLILFGRTLRYTVKLKKSGTVSREPVSNSLWKRISRKLFWIDGQEEEPESPDKPDVRNETIRIPDGEEAGEQQERSGQIRERQVRMEVLQKELEALYQEREKLCAYDRELEAVDLAMLRIRELSQRIYREAGTNFSDRASALLEELTEGRYTHIALDEKQQVKINTPARLLEMRQVSYGTMNQIYFALRMAAGDVLSGGRPLPIILDEPFAMYDEERLEAALRWLENSGRQVILFSCQKREKETLERIRMEKRGYR